MLLEVKSGEIYGLLGANGAGKSTTLNLLLGFLNQDSGIINISNNIEHIGYIPENVNLYPYLTGIENLDYFSKIANQLVLNLQQINYIIFFLNVD